MIDKFSLILFLITGCSVAQVVPPQVLSEETSELQVDSAFDNQFYENFIDDELCDKQLLFLSNDSLRFRFLDASGRIPSGILTGNLNDLGDYHHCLGIRYEEDDMNIQGKYCALVVPLDQDWPSLPDWGNVTWPNITFPELPGNLTLPYPNITLPNRVPLVEPETANAAKQMAVIRRLGERYVGFRERNSRIMPSVTNVNVGMTIAICIPKVCSTQRALKLLHQNIPANITSTEYFCRLRGDKRFVPGDYVAIVIFSLLCLLNVMSTTYDLVTKFYFKRDASECSRLLNSFSVYTNTRRLLNFPKGSGFLDCIDGFRAISMMWVVVGHTFAFTLFGYVHNILDIIRFTQSFNAVWLTSAPITVDTFFTLSGILIVYTTTSKFGKAEFLRNIHLFYLNRLLRMFPLLATVVLFQATLAFHLSDGPFWMNVANTVQNCRNWWWSALLHVQNYVNPLQTCVIQSWYLSVDTQLYMVSPLVLWWLWGHRRNAWAALIIALLLSLISSSLISFMFNFSAALGNVSRMSEINEYVTMYYFNTLARAPPFFVGMIYGYMLHIFRDKKIVISNINVLMLWLLALLMMAFCIVSIHPVTQPDFSAQTFDNFLNAYMRAIWAGALGWLIFACVMGYGGPVNWFLCLRMWKLPARLSYAMYLLHVPAIFLVNGSWVKTHYFSPGDTMYRFVSDSTITFIAAFFISVTIDAPFSTLLKLLLGEGKKSSQKPRVDSRETIVESDYHDKTTL